LKLLVEVIERLWQAAPGRVAGQPALDRQAIFERTGNLQEDPRLAGFLQ
jgi:hypothetical protein